MIIRTPDRWRTRRTSCGPFTAVSSPLWRRWSLWSRPRWLPSLPVELAAENGAGAVLVGREPSPLPMGLYRRRQSRRPRPGTWHSSSRASVSITGRMETRPCSAGPPATGETKYPGAPQRRRPRQAGTYRRPALKSAFPS